MMRRLQRKESGAAAWRGQGRQWDYWALSPEGADWGPLSLGCLPGCKGGFVPQSGRDGVVVLWRPALGDWPTSGVSEYARELARVNPGIGWLNGKRGSEMGR